MGCSKGSEGGAFRLGLVAGHGARYACDRTGEAGGRRKFASRLLCNGSNGRYGRGVGCPRCRDLRRAVTATASFFGGAQYVVGRDVGTSDLLGCEGRSTSCGGYRPMYGRFFHFLKDCDLCFERGDFDLVYSVCFFGCEGHFVVLVNRDRVTQDFEGRGRWGTGWYDQGHF